MGYCKLGYHPPHLKKNCRECENNIKDPEDMVKLRFGDSGICTTEPECTIYCHKWSICPIRRI